MDLTFFDPDQMYEWVNRLVKNPAELKALGGEIDSDLPYGISGPAAIRLDRRENPVPEEPIFTGEPSLEPKSTSSVVRSDVRYGSDGSFTLLP
jgi:hypothetical protein